MLSRLKTGGNTKVIRVMVLPPTKDKIGPKLGTLKAMNSRIARKLVLKTHLFHVKPERKTCVVAFLYYNFYGGTLRPSVACKLKSIC